MTTCTCDVVDVSTMYEGPGTRTVLGMADPACPVHREPRPVLLLPVHEIRPPEPIPAGMSVLVICAVAEKLRNSHEPIAPVEVRKVDGGWHLVEGRHRWLAHWVAGRPVIRCIEV